MNFEPFISHAAPFAVVLARLTGLFLFSPLLSSPVLPRRIRAAVCFALALAVYPTVAPSAAGASIDLLDLAPRLGAELLIGATIGLIAAIPLMSAQLGGLIMGQQMGLGLAGVINPAIDIEGDHLGQVLFVAAISAFLAAGGLEWLFAALVGSFAHVPPLGFSTSRAPLDLLVGVIASGFEVSVRVALPVLTILVLETIAMGFVSRSLPALNVMILGFPIRILLGVTILISAAALAVEAINADVIAGFGRLADWIGGGL